MRPHKPFAVGISFLLVLLSTNILAFEFPADCGIKHSQKNATIVKSKLENYKQYGAIKDGVYILCFVETDNVAFTTPISVTATINAPILIYGLNISADASLTAPLLILSGSNNTLLNSTLTGSGTGIAIQVNAPSPQPSPAGGEVVATIGPDVTIDNFEKGIFVKSGASAKITENSIKVIKLPALNMIYFETPISNSAFDEKLIGKHLSEADPNYTDKFVGNLAGKTIDSCIGNVEVLYRSGEMEGQQQKPFDYLATCSVKWIKDDADKVTLKGKDGTTTDIGASSCIFECTNISAAVDYLVTFVYTDGNGVTSDYLASTPLISNLHVINVPGLPIYTPTTSGVIVETTEPTDPVAPPQEPANFDPSNPKGQTNDTNSSDGDGGDVSQGGGSCSANLSASAPTAGGLIVQIMFLSASLLMITARRKKIAEHKNQ